MSELIFTIGRTALAIQWCWSQAHADCNYVITSAGVDGRFTQRFVEHSFVEADSYPRAVVCAIAIKQA